MTARLSAPELIVRVVTRDGLHYPRLAYEYGIWEPPTNELLASMHDLTSRVLRASGGRRWNVLAVSGRSVVGRRLYAGCELVLDVQTWEAACEGRDVLESVRTAILEGK